MNNGVKLGFGLGILFLLMKPKKSKLFYPVKAYVSGKFGDRTNPITGKPEFHNGVDLHVAANTPVHAPDEGVVSLFKNEKGGNQLNIICKSGFKYGFAHLNSYLVKDGQTVGKGQVVALSGNTGTWTTGPHLHFMVTNPDGKKVNPEDYFKFENKPV